MSRHKLPDHDNTQRAAVLWARGLDEVALLIGCAAPRAQQVNAEVVICFDPASQGPRNDWGSAMLGAEIRGDVVALHIRPKPEVAP